MSYTLKTRVNVPEDMRSSIRQKVKEAMELYIDDTGESLLIRENDTDMSLVHDEYGVFLQVWFSRDYIEIEGDVYDVGDTLMNVGLDEGVANEL